MSAERERNLTPIILGAIAGVLAIAVAVTLAMALNRPGDPPAAEPSAPASEEPAPAPDPSETEATSEEPAVESSGVALSATGITLTDDAGDEVFAYGWSDPIAPAVAALSDAFGEEPSQRIEEGDGNHYPDYTVYQWPGFALYDMVETEDGKARDEYSQPSYLRYTANTVGDIAITAEFGLSIGMPVDEARAQGPDVEQDRGGNPRLVFASERSSVVDGAPSYSLIADTDGDAITGILYFYYSDL